MAAPTQETASDFLPATRTQDNQGLSRPSLSYWQDAWIRLKKNKQALTSLIITLGLLLFTLIGPFIWQIDPAYQDLSRTSEAPSFRQTAMVTDEALPYEDLIAPGIEESPETPFVGNLPAPTDFQVIGFPSTQGVVLKWAPVPGASGYAVYRSQNNPTGEDLGLMIGEVAGANKISYQDQFNLLAETYYYTVVTKGEEESSLHTTIKVSLDRTIPLSAAQMIDPNAEAGKKITLKAHPMGTDYLGRDVLARLMAGGAVSLGIGFFAPLLSTLLGIVIGGVAGYMGGKVDAWLMRITDFVLALPFLLFIILFKIAFGAGAGESGITAMMVSLVALSWTTSARFIRGQVLQLRETEFVHAAKLLGASPAYIILRHLLPNTLGILLVSLTFEIPRAIFTEAFLSFIGMGVVPPTPSWGSMCNDGTQTFLNHPHEFFFPALIISVTVLAFNLLGDGLRDALDPKMRSVQ